MLNGIYQAAVNTPWWVYLLFVLLIKIGIKASKPGVVSLKKMAVTPTIFTVMAFETLFNNLSLTFFVVSIFSAAMLVGMLIGWWQIHRQPMRFDRKKYLIKVEGTWSVLVVILIIFASKYYFGYELAADLTALTNTGFEVAFISVTAVCAGMFVGKFLCYLKRMFTEPHNDLTLNVE